MATSLSPEVWMRRAIAVSRRGLPAPNPHVGCVIVQKDRCIAEGFHRYAGGLHAEAEALAVAGDAAAGGEAYVTLEPCNHHGRQPPCVEALVRARVAKVWIAVLDPNPKVAGGGAEALRQAGVKVEVGLLAPEAETANHPWLTAMRRGRPYVALKAAIGLDGRIAGPDGESHWITGERARRAARRLRAELGAVLVGSETVRVDDPMLTARIRGLAREPVRTVLDPDGVLTGTEKVFRVPGKVLRLVAGPAVRAEDRTVAIGEEGFAWTSILALLWREGVTGVLIEGGSRTLSGIWKAGLADRLDLFVGNVALGEGLTWLNTPTGEPLAGQRRWSLVSVRRLGEDAWLRYEPKP